MSVVTHAVLERIASMVLHQVSEEMIARVSGITVEALREVMDGEEFRNLFAEKATEEFQQQELLNGGWDSVEAMSLNTVVNFLKSARDPEFALKAAMLSNKAIRRSGSKQQAVNVQQAAGASVVIQLPSVFLSQVNVQGNGVRTVETVTHSNGVAEILDMSQRKVTDMMPIKQVTAMLQKKKSEKEEIAEMMASVGA